LITSYWAVCSIVSGDLSEFLRNPGPKIRGALGYCLRRESEERKIDLIRLMFKPDRRFLGRGFMLRRLKHPPPPFIIPPPRIISSNLIEVGLKFYGRIGLDSRLIVSLMKKFEERVFPGNVKLSIEEVYSIDDLRNISVKHFSNQEFIDARPPIITLEDVDSWVRENSNRNLKEFKICFLTPFKLLRDGKPITIEEFKLSDLVRFILRRIFILEYLYSGRILPWMNPTHVSLLKDEADRRTTIEKKLKNSNIKVEGGAGFLEGNIILTFREDREKDIFKHEILRCLKIGELVGVGKNTSYGFGQYKLIF